MRRSWLALALLLALAPVAGAEEGVGGAAPAVEAQDPTRPAGAQDNPHGRPDACSACHGVGDAGVGAPLPPTATCRGCHPTANMHPVGVKPQDAPVPAGWPLEDDAVGCATCHDEAACDSSDRPAPWLRGGPPAELTDFCFRCHEADGYQRTDPHHPTGAEPDGTCAACHTGPAPEDAAPAQAKLRGTPDQLCASCHDGPPHPGAAEHLGATVPEEDRAALGSSLLLGEGGTIRCWTCHDVHDHARAAATPPNPRVRATADALRALARPNRSEVEPVGTAHPPLLAVPAEGDALCRTCHGAGGG